MTEDTSINNNEGEEQVAATQEGEISAPPVSVPDEIRELLEAGVQFGHIKSAVHPGMFPYIFGTRNNIHIIDVEKTSKKLDEALAYLKELAANNKKVLFVGTRLPFRGLVEEAATATGMPFITTYWPGGLLTNWSTIMERIARLKELEELMKSEGWAKYTKQERALMTREFEKLQSRWGGIKNMATLPDALFLVDAHDNQIAIAEARIKKIPVVAITDTNVNPIGMKFVIPANDDAVSSVALILSKVKSALGA
ncbi:MAG: 30S ribosomal protein S2 [Candidatus Spechtbacterales bacterium]